jgi:hypothetical protein
MYKLTRPSGFDFYSGTINYRAAIGTTVRVTDYDPPEKGSCGRGLHASRNPNDCFIGAKIPCAAFRVKGIQPIAKDSRKTRYQALKVLEEIHDIDKLFGWKYSEAANPVDPFGIDPPKIKEKHIRLLKKWAPVHTSAVNSVWASVSASVWNSVSASVWGSVKNSVWDSVWGSVRDSVRDPVLASVWDSIANSVLNSVWAYVSSLFPNIKKWEGINHEPGTNPFQSGIDLWRMGLVPSYDGEIWRLHGGSNGRVLWQGNI